MTLQGNQPHTALREENTFRVSLINNNTDGSVTAFLYLRNAASRCMNNLHLLFTAGERHM